MSRKIVHNILVIKKKKRVYTYEHYNEHYLHVTEKSKNREVSYDVDMAVMKPESHYEIHIPWNWLIASALAIGVLAGMVTHLVFNPELKKILIMSPLMVVAFVFVIMAIKQFSAGYDRRRVFLSRYAAFPILQIPYDRRNRNKFYQFIAQIEQYVELSINKRRIPEEVLQAGEMKTLRRLTSEGILSQNQYNTAKNRIFKKIDEITA